jgi:U3 small nucleolar RNA-associated protein 23
MRIKRGRNYKRIVKFYRVNYGFHEPYAILADGNFLHEFVKAGQDVKRLLGRLLTGVVHMVITDCVFQEVRSLKDRLTPGTFELVASYSREACRHDELIDA